jgi:hypothetical protein
MLVHPLGNTSKSAASARADRGIIQLGRIAECHPEETAGKSRLRKADMSY